MRPPRITSRAAGLALTLTACTDTLMTRTR